MPTYRQPASPSPQRPRPARTVSLRCVGRVLSLYQTRLPICQDMSALVTTFSSLRTALHSFPQTDCWARQLCTSLWTRSLRRKLCGRNLPALRVPQGWGTWKGGSCCLRGKKPRQLWACQTAACPRLWPGCTLRCRCSGKRFRVLRSLPGTLWIGSPGTQGPQACFPGAAHRRGRSLYSHAVQAPPSPRLMTGGL